MPLRPRHPLARSYRCKLLGINRPVRFNERFHRGLRTWCGNGGPGIPVESGQMRIYGVAGQRAECRDEITHIAAWTVRAGVGRARRKGANSRKVA